LRSVGVDYLGYMSNARAPLYSRYDNIKFDNSNSVDLAVLVEELRPEELYVSGDQLVFWVPFDHDSPIAGTWTVTAKRHHERYTGELQLEIDELTDLTEPVRKYLRAPEEEDDD
jgi:hypothetical protein